MTPEISIITGTRNRPESLRRFLKSVHASASIPTQLIIADASDSLEELPSPLLPSEGSPHVIKTSYYCERPQLGTVKGYNAAFHRATGRYTCWFNDDCSLLPGWDKIAIDFMDAHREIGAGVIYFKDAGMSGYYVQEQPLAQHGNIVTANFAVIPTDLGNQVGWFDEREVFIPELGRSEALTHYGCDNSVILSILNAGFGVCQIPGCKVIHHRENDESRREKMAEHMNCLPLPPGSKSGRILWLLWNDPNRADAEGYRRLKAEYEKHRRMIGPIHIGD